MAARTQLANSASVVVTSATASTIAGSGLGAWLGYHMAIASSSSTSPSPWGQPRYMYASAGPADTLRVSPEFDVIPSIGDDLIVAWNQDDYDGGWGNDFKLVLKAAAEWDVGASPATIGDGTDMYVGGIYNQAFSQDEYWDILAGSVFVVGSLSADESLGGWYWNSNNANSTLGFQYIRVQASAILAVYNTNCGTVFPHAIICHPGSFNYFYDASFTNLMYNGSRLKGNTYGRNLKFQGTASAVDYVVVASGIENFYGPLILSDSYGIRSSVTAEFLRINRFVGVNNTYDVEANNSTSWTFANPTWDANFLWTQTDGSSDITELFTVSANVAQTDGAVIASAVFHITTDILENGSSTLRQRHIFATAGVSGLVSQDVTRRYWASSTASTLYYNHITRAWKYGYQPYEAAGDYTSESVFTIAMSPDSEITTSTPASALLHEASFSNHATDYDGIWRVQVSITTTATVSALVSTGGSYEGVIQEIYQAGDGLTAEWILAKTSSTTGQPASTATAWQEFGITYGTNVAGEGHKFSWHIDAQNEALWEAYDKQQAYFADASTTTAWVSTVRTQRTELIEKTGTNYVTEAYYSAGCFVTNRGTGTVNYMTADDGWTFTPPTQYTFTLTGVKAGTEVRLFHASTRDEITGVEELYANSYVDDSGFDTPGSWVTV